MYFFGFHGVFGDSSISASSEPRRARMSSTFCFSSRVQLPFRFSANVTISAYFSMFGYSGIFGAFNGSGIFACWRTSYASPLHFIPTSVSNMSSFSYLYTSRALRDNRSYSSELKI